jgi:hypothetical protein
MNTKSNSHVLGAAHHGPATGHRWMRAPLLAPEDGGGSGAPPPAPPPASPPPPVNAKTFTEDEVTRIVQERLERDRRARPAAPAAAPPPAPVDDGTDEKLSLKHIKAQLDEEKRQREADKRRSAFDKQALRLDMTESQMDDFYALSELQKPADVKEWLLAKGFKPVSTTTTSPATPAPTAAAAPASTDAPKPPAAAPSAPSAHALPTSNGVVDLFAMTPAQHQQLGPKGVRAALETLWEIGNTMNGMPQRPKVPNQR